MHHVAIMNPKTCPVSDIVSGKKTIESRWYKNRAAPWNKINSGDTIYFKESGKPVSAQAKVEKIIQYEDLTPEKTREIISMYGTKISPVHMKEFIDQAHDKKYCILIFLTAPKPLKPFYIKKNGFGSAAAWLVVDTISKIKKTA